MKIFKKAYRCLIVENRDPSKFDLKVNRLWNSNLEISENKVDFQNILDKVKYIGL